MGGWLGWLFLFAALYLVVAGIRGGIQFASWLIDEYIVEPRALRHPQKRRAERPHRNKPTALAATHASDAAEAGPRKAPSLATVQAVRQPRRPSVLGRGLQRLSAMLHGKHYDYWVAAALSEDDRSLRLQYLSKALKLNPAYLPAWGMKGNTLLELKRYDEAAECFDHSLQLHPSALVGYKKAMCLQHSGKRDEALACLDEADRACPSQDRGLADDVTRLRRLLEDEVRAAGSR